MSFVEWAVLAAGLAVGCGVVSMLMGERRAREGRLQDRGPERKDEGQGRNQGGHAGDGPA